MPAAGLYPQAEFKAPDQIDVLETDSRASEWQSRLVLRPFLLPAGLPRCALQRIDARQIARARPRRSSGRFVLIRFISSMREQAEGW